MTAPINYPLHLFRNDIYALLPHRGDMQLIQQLTVLTHNHFQGIAAWSEESPILKGHFPGMPIVPGVMLVEAVAQVAGAGMLVGDPHANSVGQEGVGLLAGIRKCSFRRLVLPGDEVAIDVNTRQMSEMAAAISARVTVRGEEAGQVELVIINSPRSVVETTLAALRSDATAPVSLP
jgi:3-hydroxyacyl-[acyl-carrier-protein] dehydratase